MQNIELFSNAQDEAIMSERNEREQFQSDSSKEDDNSNDDSIQNEEEQEINPKESQGSTFPEQQVIKDETKKKDIKETCLEKIKAYIGFGHSHLLLNERIGSIFFLPIPSRWPLKIQVTIAQIIIAITSFSLFVGVQQIGQNILFDTVLQWTNNNVSSLLQKQICEVTIDFVQILIKTRENEIQLMNVTINLIQSGTLRYKDVLYSIDNQIPKSSKKQISKEGIIDQYTLDVATYSLLKDQQVSENQIRKYLSINNIMYYNYQTLGSTFFWIFDDGFMMQYPGLNVTNVKLFNEHRLKMYNSRRYLTNIPIEHTYDPILGSILQREVLPINDDNNNQIGLIFCERMPIMLFLLFNQIAINNQYNYTLFLLSSENDILHYEEREYKINIEEFQELIKTINTEDSKLKKMNISKFHFDSISVSSYFELYYGELQDQCFILAYINYKGIFLGIFQPTFLPKQEIGFQKRTYSKKVDSFNQKLIPLALSIPILYIILCVFYMVRYIKPLQRITEYADQLLKKSQNFDENQFEKQFTNSTGDDLIQQLTSLFAKLMGNLNKSKQLKKQEIIDFYNKQTYPKNQKPRDVTPIINQVKKIKLDSILRDPGVLQFPNLDD
ncbi:unnamed protein product (macronuclear) [Paramecium tetraurelia]|uniref:Transmembrane protein n=1 Tax=Paramecium tetraurelia TaxID=5888 RepID=A0DHM8_PARTE|nr:uncharacterized protein GSPATT00016932001 [Paramecium tetraurelia]CAK82545.1 unnamed protein product [Paramecium tetraurelia]|eukprot:XP_001449942.1 hypothetical protein (macronuclear) [Paramecium tetraurelia strain d4-2]